MTQEDGVTTGDVTAGPPLSTIMRRMLNVTRQSDSIKFTHEHSVSRVVREVQAKLRALGLDDDAVLLTVIDQDTLRHHLKHNSIIKEAHDVVLDAAKEIEEGRDEAAWWKRVSFWLGITCAVLLVGFIAALIS